MNIFERDESHVLFIHRVLSVVGTGLVNKFVGIRIHKLPYNTLDEPTVNKRIREKRTNKDGEQSCYTNPRCFILGRIYKAFVIKHYRKYYRDYFIYNIPPTTPCKNKTKPF